MQDPVTRDPIADLRRIAFLMERARESSYRTKAFRKAAAALESRAQAGEDLATINLTSVPGVGAKTAACVRESLASQVPTYLAERESAGSVDPAGDSLRALLRGDCHTHSDWSDGGSPIEEMALAARDLGHEYVVLTDHSPRLTVANGLSPERLAKQLDVVAALNEIFTAQAQPFRILTGIEVDILDDGSLDQEPELLNRLDLVVASVHSGLRQPRAEMTARMLAAIANPRVNILGHCTGRLVISRRETGQRTRPESEFDSEAVFAAAVAHNVAIEINSRPERQDPPTRLMVEALAAGCQFAIDTDAHAPGQLDWQPYGCARAVAAGLTTELAPARVINTWPTEQLLAWTAQGRKP